MLSVWCFHSMRAEVVTYDLPYDIVRHVFISLLFLFFLFYSYSSWVRIIEPDSTHLKCRQKLLNNYIQLQQIGFKEDQYREHSQQSQKTPDITTQLIRYSKAELIPHHRNNNPHTSLLSPLNQLSPVSRHFRDEQKK